MINTVVSLFKNKDIRKKIMFTLAMLLVFRIGAGITVPGIDTTKLISISENQLITMMSILGAGSWQQFSIFSMGVGPYITASLVVELLAMDIIPALADLQKEGQKGRQQMDKIVRYVAVVLAFIQAYTLTMTFANSYDILTENTVTNYLYVATILTAGTFLLVWIGDRIAAFGIGNGISMIIFAGIVANLPYQFYSSFYSLVDFTAESSVMISGLLKFLLLVVMYIAIIVLVIFVNNAQRKIPIQYTTNSNRKGSKDINYLPLKINSASVIPVIFASTVMVAPSQILNLIKSLKNFKATDFTKTLTTIFDFLSDFTKPGGLILYVVLIFAFTFFYTNLEVDPEKIAENLNKSGAYIPGVRPGKETQQYVSKVLNRITLLGALFLCFIAALPYLLSMFTDISSTITMGGTSIIIVVGVALETVKDLENQLTQKEYKGFMKR